MRSILFYYCIAYLLLSPVLASDYFKVRSKIQYLRVDTILQPELDQYSSVDNPKITGEYKFDYAWQPEFGLGVSWKGFDFVAVVNSRLTNDLLEEWDLGGFQWFVSTSDLFPDKKAEFSYSYFNTNGIFIDKTDTSSYPTYTKENRTFKIKSQKFKVSFFPKDKEYSYGITVHLSNNLLPVYTGRLINEEEIYKVYLTNLETTEIFVHWFSVSYQNPGWFADWKLAAGISIGSPDLPFSHDGSYTGMSLSLGGSAGHSSSFRLGNVQFRATLGISYNYNKINSTLGDYGEVTPTSNTPAVFYLRTFTEFGPFLELSLSF